MMHLGQIKFYNKIKKYGFITANDKRDVFFHLDDINHSIEPIKGDQVEFEVEQSEKSLRAKKIDLIFG